MPSNRRDRKKQGSRRKPFLDPKRRLLVVCEGKNTEPQYIRGLAYCYRNAILEITIPTEQGDPKRLVELAKANTDVAAQNARRSKDENWKYDETWCVFDRDDHERFDDACQMASDNGFGLAVSNPSFELWLLLHFRENPGAQHRDRIKELLADEVANYDKKVDFSSFAKGLRDAGARAKRIDDHAREDGEDLLANPSTSVYVLVGSMLKELKDQEPFKHWDWLQQTLTE